MRSTGEPRRRRSRGFTLVEVLLVFALMAALGAIVWPAIDGPFAAERLRAVAEQLQADLVRARVAAVDSGTPHRLALVPGQRQYALYAAGFGATTQPSAAIALGGVGDPTAAGALPAFHRALPEEVTLQAVELAAAETAQPGLVPGAVDVLFQPDGTTSTVKIVLVNERQMHVSVRLRGLTGAATVSDVSAASDPLVAGAASP